MMIDGASDNDLERKLLRTDQLITLTIGRVRSLVCSDASLGGAGGIQQEMHLM